MSPFKRHPQVLVVIIMLHSAEAMATIGMATGSHVLLAHRVMHQPQAFVATQCLTDYLSITTTKHSPLFSANPAVAPLPTSSAGSATTTTNTSCVKEQLLNC